LKLDRAPIDLRRISHTAALPAPRTARDEVNLPLIRSPRNRTGLFVVIA
jgi:hypothetical protein